MTNKKLTDKQKQFCKEYLIDLNATQAAVRAGYSHKTAYSIGQENLTKPEIANYVQSLMDKRSKKTEITADYVLEVIQETMEKSRQDDDKQNTYKGAELLGKHLKLFTDRIDVDAKVKYSFLDMVEDDIN